MFKVHKRAGMLNYKMPMSSFLFVVNKFQADEIQNDIIKLNDL